FGGGRFPLREIEGPFPRAELGRRRVDLIERRVPAVAHIQVVQRPVTWPRRRTLRVSRCGRLRQYWNVMARHEGGQAPGEDEDHALHRPPSGRRMVSRGM